MDKSSITYTPSFLGWAGESGGIMTGITIEPVNEERLEAFLLYCRQYRDQVDDSFLVESELADFAIHENYPSYIAVDEAGRTIGAVSLIIDAYHRLGRRGRFRILHTEHADPAVYRRLLEAALTHAQGLEHVFVFVPTAQEKVMETLPQIGFRLERYSFILINDNPGHTSYEVPDGYELRTFRNGLDEEAWAEVRNKGFARLKGSETPITAELVAKMTQEGEHIDGGMLLLYHGDKPVGIVRGADEPYDGKPAMNIGPLALLPEYQGQGLGRLLLRAALSLAAERGYARASLCVNAENERAKQLYLQEGFYQAEAVANFRYELVRV